MYFQSLLPNRAPSTSTRQSLNPPHLTYITSLHFALNTASATSHTIFWHLILQRSVHHHDTFIPFRKAALKHGECLSTADGRVRAKLRLGTKSQLQSPKARSRRRIPAALAYMLDDQRSGEGSHVCSFNQRHASQRSAIRMLSHFLLFLTASRLPPNLVRREHDPC